MNALRLPFKSDAMTSTTPCTTTVRRAGHLAAPLEHLVSVKNTYGMSTNIFFSETN